MNTVLLLGALMLGGLCSGEFFRRILNLPRTTGYALFGLLSGRHGFGWIDHQLIDSATLFIDLALGLIVFELGQKLHSEELHCSGKRILLVGFCESLVSFLAVLLLLHTLGFSLGVAAFAAGIAISTSPAITIATCSDVGARGPHSQLLFHLVAINGCLAIGFISLISPLLNAGNLDASLVWLGIQSIAISTAIGLCGALAILAGARLLGKHPEHQHILILSLILITVGLGLLLDLSLLLSQLLMGALTKRLDRQKRVVSIRIASDARLFMVITFIFAGAMLDLSALQQYWDIALLVALARIVSKTFTLFYAHEMLQLTPEQSLAVGIGLMPMSSVALTLLAEGQSFPHGQGIIAVINATIFIMQLAGPYATQTAIKNLGEASLLPGHRGDSH